MRLPLLLACLLATRCLAWGPHAHEFLGRQGASSAGLDARLALAVSSGSLLADLDHTLANAGVVNDSTAFARAMAQAPGGTPLSDRFASGWLAHALAQDPGQQEISSRDAKLCADMILVRTAGFPSGAVVFDVERIRAAAQKLGAPPPPPADVVKAAEKLVLLTLVETAALDMLPLDIDQAREMMPPELRLCERRLDGSLRDTVAVLGASLDTLAARLTGAPHAHRGDVIGLPPAVILGVDFTTRQVAPGVYLTTSRLARPFFFRTAIRVVIAKLGKRLFPAAAESWDAGARVKSVTKALRDHLAESANRIEALFRDQRLR